MEKTAYTPSQLGQALRQCRKAEGRTQVQVGEAADLLPKTVSGLESSPERSQVGNLFKLISALGMELVLRPKVDESRRPPSSEW